MRRYFNHLNQFCLSRDKYEAGGTPVMQSNKMLWFFYISHLRYRDKRFTLTSTSAGFPFNLGTSQVEAEKVISISWEIQHSCFCLSAVLSSSTVSQKGKGKSFSGIKFKNTAPHSDFYHIKISASKHLDVINSCNVLQITKHQKDSPSMTDCCILGAHRSVTAFPSSQLL